MNDFMQFDPISTKEKLIVISQEKEMLRNHLDMKERLDQAKSQLAKQSIKAVEVSKVAEGLKRDNYKLKAQVSRYRKLATENIVRANQNAEQGGD